MTIKITRVQSNIIHDIEKMVEEGDLDPTRVNEHIEEAKAGNRFVYNAFLTFKRGAIKRKLKGLEIDVPRNQLYSTLEHIKLKHVWTPNPIITRNPVRNTPETRIEYDDDPSRPKDEVQSKFKPETFREDLDAAIWAHRRPQDYMPGKLIEDAMRGLGMTRGRDGFDEAVMAATRSLSKKMAFVAVSSMRPGRQFLLPIPPNPSSDYFDEFMAQKLGIAEHRVRDWKRWDGFPRMAANIFAVILADGISPELAATYAKKRDNEIALMGRWYNDIDGMGMGSDVDAPGSSYDEAGAIGRMYKQPDDADRIRRAKANYARFDKTLRADPHYDGASVKALYDDMLALHQDNLYMGKTDFMRRLTPYVQPMTAEEIEIAFHRQDVPKELREQNAINVLKLHTRTLHGFAGHLMKVLADNHGCNSINSFCRNRLGFTEGMSGWDGRAPAALVGLLERMASKGVKLEKLLQTMKDQFPPSISRQKIDKLITLANEKRAGAVAMTIATPRMTAAASAAIDAPSVTVRTSGNGPRKVRRRIKPGGTQLSLDLTAKYRMDGGIANYMIAGRRLPMFPGPRTMMNMGFNLMHMKNI